MILLSSLLQLLLMMLLAFIFIRVLGEEKERSFLHRIFKWLSKIIGWSFFILSIVCSVIHILQMIVFGWR